MAEYPIQRLIVYNIEPGVTHVTWDMHPKMNDPGDYEYQLQVNRLPNPDDPEWKDVGNSVTNAIAIEDRLDDPDTRCHGFQLDKYYRIKLTTCNGDHVYFSPIEGCFGQLHRYEWKLVQEITRKEKLRHNNVSIPCVLLKVRTSGEKCPNCTNGVSGISNNSECPFCYGTGYLGGYYAPFNFNMVEISPTQLMEKHESDNVTTLNLSDNRYEGRALGVPEILLDDIIVDLSTSQRFRVQGSQVISQLRRVPIARKLDLVLLPWSNPAYKIPIGIDDYYTEKGIITDSGCGYVLVDTDFPGAVGPTLEEATYPKTNIDSLQYVYKGMPVSGGTVDLYAISKNEQEESVETLVFTTTTDAQGRWNKGYMADIGEYRINLYKPGYYKTTTAYLKVTQDLISTEEEKEKQKSDEKAASTNYTQKFF